MSTVSAVGESDVDVFATAFTRAPELAAHSSSAQRVLAVCAALFHRYGAAATSIRDITKACGLTPGAFYRHFASKDEVLFVLVSYGHQRVEQRIEAALGEAGPDAASRLAAFVRAYVAGHLEQPELAQLVRREYLHLSSERHASVVRRRRALRAHLARLLADGAAQQELDLPGGADNATRVAVMLLDMCSRTAEWYRPGRDRTPHQMAQLYVTAALRLAGAS